MADRMEVDMIVKAVAQGFDKVENEIKGVGGASETAGKQAERGSKGMGQMGMVMKTAVLGGAAIAGAAMLKFGKDSIAAASFVEESSSKFAVVFGDMADSVTARLNDFAEASGQSRYQLAAFAATMGDTLKPMGFTLEAAGDLSVSIVQLATDLASFNNMPVDEALRRLQSTLIGNHENALAFGVIINENTLKQELAAMGADKLTGAMLEQAKAQARYNLLLRGTTDAQGDAVRTADSYANQQKALASAIEELSVSFGQLLLPAATATVGALREVVKQLTIVSDVAGKASDVIEDIVDAQIAQADSTQDLVESYKRAGDQLNLYGGFAALLTGTTGDLVDAQKAYASAIVDSAKSGDEYVNALRQIGLIGFGAQQMTEEQALAYYEAEKAARAAAKATEELNAEYRKMERAVEAAYTPTVNQTEATDDATWSTYEWASAVGMQVAQAKIGAQAMERRVAELNAQKEAEDAAAEAVRAHATALLGWYTTAVNSADAAFVVNEKTGEMSASLDNANQSLYDIIAAAEPAPAVLALAGVALGTVSEEAANAALKSMIFTEGLKKIVDQALETGPLTAEAILNIKKEAAELLETVNQMPDIIDLEFESNAAAQRAEFEELRAAALAVAGVYNVQFEYTTTGTGGAGVGAGSTGQAGAPGGPTIVANALGTGGEFVTVPPGYPNDSYLMAVQSGEDYMVRTPADRANGVGAGGVTINVDARGAGPGVRGEVMRAVEEAMAAQGRNADSRIRTR
jgi:hypothetical protein